MNAIGEEVSNADDLMLNATRREVRLCSRSPARDLVKIEMATPYPPESGVLGN